MRRTKRLLMGEHRDISRSGRRWSRTGALLAAIQPVIILMVVTRVCGPADAGIFAIANVAGGLFMMIGNYGVRDVEAADSKRHFKFWDYLGARITTCFFMMVFSVLYVLYGLAFNDYTPRKALIVLLVCIMRLIDSVEDVFCGYYQQKGRLDVGAHVSTLRLVLSTLAVCLVLVVTKDLLIASAVGVVVCLMIAIAFNFSVYTEFVTIRTVYSFWRIKRLIVECAAAFVAAFLSYYVCHAPRFAIDAYLPQELQAYYGYLTTPMLVVSLAHQFFYRKALPALDQDWRENNSKRFARRICRQFLYMAALTAGLLICGYLFGVQLLSVMFAADLRPYKTELMLRLTASGLFAAAGFLSIVLTIIQDQKDLMSGYMIVAVLAWIVAHAFVRRSGLAGAAWADLFLMAALTAIFAMFLIHRAAERKRTRSYISADESSGTVRSV